MLLQVRNPNFEVGQARTNPKEGPHWRLTCNLQHSTCNSCNTPILVGDYAAKFPSARLE
jgi:hypothetical protein